MSDADSDRSGREASGDRYVPTEVPSRRRAADPLGLLGSSLFQYDVEEYLGGGGMGVVYRAHDRRLDRTVALKFLPSIQSRDEEARQRFLVEARAASKLDHPNICTVYEIGETDEGQFFIAMAYYDGETLKQRIARGPLPLPEALDVARQVGLGLARAHGERVIHRDIKPANVMVLPDGTAKILDFGTAKVGDLELTQTGGLVGTVKYMSPEQADGREIDLRTDIWSLGALTYEMIAGRAPFTGGSAQAVLYAAINETPRPLSEVVKGTPAAIQRLIERCLEKDRAERFASAEVFVEALDDAAVAAGIVSLDSSHGATHPGRPVTLRPARRPAKVRWAALGLAALAAVALGVQAVRSLVGPDGAMVEEGRTYLAVLPFTASDPADEVTAAGLTHSLTSLVSRLGTSVDALWVVPASEIRGQGVSTASQARSLFPVNAVLLGHLQRLGGGVELALELVDPDPEALRVVAAAVLPGPEAAGFQDEAHAALRGMLGVSSSGASGEVDGGTTSPSAYGFYVQARGYALRVFDPESLASAVELYRAAISEDPEFAQAHAGLCEAVWEQYRDTNDLALAREAIASCDRGAELAASDPAVLVALGNVYVQTGEYRKAEATLRRVLQLDPGNADALRWLGRSYEGLGETDRAIGAYREAIELRREVWAYHDELAILLFYNNRLEDARPYWEQVTRLSPDNPVGYNGLALIDMWSGRFAEAEGFLRLSLDKQPNVIGYRNLAYIRLQLGDYAGALEQVAAGLEMSETDWYSWRWRAHAHHWRGDGAEAEAAWRRLIELGDDLVEVNPNDPQYLIGLAEAYVTLGESEVGRAYLERAEALPSSWNYVTHYKARVNEMLGDREAALAWLDVALEAGYDTLSLASDRWLEDLRSDPAYRALLERRGAGGPGA